MTTWTPVTNNTTNWSKVPDFDEATWTVHTGDQLRDQDGNGLIFKYRADTVWTDRTTS
jgi:hypothetical protein